jgi:hypothetical protein
MRRRRPKPETAAERFAAFDHAVKRHRAAQRIAAIKVRAPLPAAKVVAAKRRVSPTTISDLTRIVDDPKRSAIVRAKAAALLIKIGYGEPEDPNNADG